MKALFALSLLLAANVATAFPTCNPNLPNCQLEDTVQRRFKIYNRPVIEGGRLDWCLNWGTQCGRPAAQEFCQRNGHDGVWSFKIDNDIGYTKLLNGQVCSASHCDGFDKITCTDVE